MAATIGEAAVVARVVGSYSNVVGLPLELVNKLLKSKS